MTDVIEDMKSCEESGIMDVKLGKNFSTSLYHLRIYTAGMYYFEAEGENWDGVGITIINSTKVITLSERSCWLIAKPFPAHFFSFWLRVHCTANQLVSS